MKPVEEQYLDLLRDIRDNGTVKQGRNGNTRSLFGTTLKHSMAEGMPILTTKQVSLKNVASELCFFLSGEPSIIPMLKQNNNIWLGDCYANYLKNHSKTGPNANLSSDDFKKRLIEEEEYVFGKIWGSIGSGYGPNWRGRYVSGIESTPRTDQISSLLKQLKETPDSRRMYVTAWNVDDVEQGNVLLPPCHLSFQVYTRELTIIEQIDYLRGKGYESVSEYDKYNTIYDPRYIIEKDILDGIISPPTRSISLSWNMRSLDFALGCPYNIASYALLLEMIALEVNMIPDQLIGTFGDTHLYENQIPLVDLQLHRIPFKLPKIQITKAVDLFSYTPENFNLIDYQYQPRIDYPLSN